MFLKPFVLFFCLHQQVVEPLFEASGRTFAPSSFAMSQQSPFDTREAGAASSSWHWKGGNQKAAAPKLNKYGKPWQSMHGNATVLLQSEVVYVPMPAGMKHCFPESGEGSYRWFRAQCQDSGIGVSYRERSFHKLTPDVKTKPGKTGKQNFLVLKGPRKTSIRLLASLFQHLDSCGFNTADARQGVTTQCNKEDVVLLTPSEHDEAPAAEEEEVAAAATASPANAAESDQQPPLPNIQTTTPAPTAHSPTSTEQVHASQQEVASAGGRTSAGQDPTPPQPATTAGGRTSAEQVTLEPKEHTPAPQPTTTGGETSVPSAAEAEAAATADVVTPQPQVVPHTTGTSSSSSSQEAAEHTAKFTRFLACLL